ncbi:MAG TPA: septum formation initiator family protein [Methanosarcinales archaeon]|nr:septum formation initiator family protein [Methanosarcinales archaeon]
MGKNIKVIGGLSRKAKINIFIAVFIVFILLSVFSSLNQISNIIKKRENLIVLEEKLNSSRNNNIKLLAEEKSLYQDEAIELEARKQFNMTKGFETNYFVQIEEEQIKEDQPQSLLGNVYSDSNLWGNIAILYNREIKE